MIKVVIVTHGYLAEGLKSSTEFIMGKQENLEAIPAYTEEFPRIDDILKKIIDSGETTLFVTDVFGGSVNNEIEALLPNNPQIRLVCGANLPFLIQLFNSLMTANIDDAINSAIKAAKEGIQNCTKVMNSSSTSFDSF
ncbi:PTS sugar transporter subunit IIA [Pediococcus parvulus]|uniref:PTS sugar transporter subunit IIA n=1 Tax=Pediococcus parvulus TaxID=54062 RepID=UPI003757041C